MPVPGTERPRVHRGALPADVAESAHAMVHAATAVDGVAPLSDEAVKAIDAGEDSPVVHVWTDASYANIVPGRDGEPAMIEAVVHPDHRRRGLGRALLDTAFGAAQALGPNGVRVWAHGDLPAAVALATSMGLEKRRELLQLRRPVGEGHELPELVVDPSIVLRTYAGPEDHAEILRVNNAAFDWHPEQGGWSMDQIAERVGSDWFDPEGLFLAFDASDPQTLLGFHWTKLHDADLGEVYIVGVDPQAQGRGLGRLLTLAGLHHLARRGVREINLYVEGDNTAALRTYERLGFSRYAVDVAYG
ncbi:mycothiol synthase [Gordonia paraffinivorans]|uniref:Mycothiol acetyltransferase n=2 Tax=Gordonia paraffinivorans TaxID=175628 RepID=A0ABQ0IPK5_9ACTN|nr:mycothiol synthase [Gordonia paraffinivorans]MCD2147159.1 mycothiol synthase [Gordonia paraffinivorans]GAC85496.1 mycothiol acetyltransferase [Gordonia paraffinivorans NBRC 108238]VFA88208.1 Mycothiol acetyltransferase [Gordonia paraffinivorans]